MLLCFNFYVLKCFICSYIISAQKCYICSYIIIVLLKCYICSYIIIVLLKCFICSYIIIVLLKCFICSYIILVLYAFTWFAHTVYCVFFLDFNFTLLLKYFVNKKLYFTRKCQRKIKFYENVFFDIDESQTLIRWFLRL